MAYKRISAVQLRESQINTVNLLAKDAPINHWDSRVKLHILETLQHIAYNLHMLADGTNANVTAQLNEELQRGVSGAITHDV